MAYCKVCACGEKVTFPQPDRFPIECPKCGRALEIYDTYVENDARAEALVRERRGEEKEEPGDDSQNEKNALRKHYALRLPDGVEIPIPEEGGIIGRAELGGEQLAHFFSVSRQHMRVIPKRQMGVLVEDLSSYGTLLNGVALIKNEPTLARVGAKLTLCDLETSLVIKGEEKDEAY